MVFPFLAMFRMAQIIFRLVYSALVCVDISYISMLLQMIGCMCIQLNEWMTWWMTLYIRWGTKIIGNAVNPIYEGCLKYLDKTAVLSIRHKRSTKRKGYSGCQILTLPGALCVFTEIHNVYAQDLAMLSQKQFQYKNSIPHNLLMKWAHFRKKLVNILQMDGHCDA